MLLLCRTKYEARDKQQQGRVESLEKEKNSLHDELKNTVNELTQVRVSNNDSKPYVIQLKFGTGKDSMLVLN